MIKEQNTRKRKGRNNLKKIKICIEKSVVFRNWLLLEQEINGVQKKKKDGIDSRQ